MKKVLMFCALVLLLASSAIAINIESKTSFQPGETFLAKIQGKFFSPITPEDIYFISDRENIPLVFDLLKVENTYYIYAMLPVQERNYTILIQNVHYYENGRESLGDIESNFSVSGNVSDFSVFPGFILAKKNFTITIESYNKDLNIAASVQNQTKNILVPLGESKQAIFSVSSTNFTSTFLSLTGSGTKYEIPVFILSSSSPSTTEENQTVNITESDKFSFTKSFYNFSANVNKESAFDIYLKNLKDSDVNNINIDVSSNLKNTVSISPRVINLSSGSAARVSLSVISDSIGTVLGEITASSDSVSASSDIVVHTLSESAVIPNTTTTTSLETCLVYGGTICKSSETCSATKISSSDSNGNCCIGTCQPSKSYTGTIIGILIFIVIAVAVFFVYKKYKTKKAPTPNQIMQKKASEFESRLAGGKEVRGSLSKS